MIYFIVSCQLRILLWEVVMSKKKGKYKIFKQKSAYTLPGTGPDPMGSYTGYPVFVDEPEQDADDL